METKLKGAWEKVKNFFKNMSTKVRIILGAALAAVIILAAALILWSSNQPYTTLFTGLNATEISSILSYFQENGITDYRLENDSIMVREDQQSVLTARLAMAGYPKSGSLYESYFENVGTMSTTSERATAWLVGVQQRLEATIRQLDGVVDALVNINLGEERTYVFENVDTNSSASVMLTLREGYTLTDQQADAIRGIVSHAIKGMTFETVAITDQAGNPYSGGDGLTDLSDTNALKRKMEEYYNNLIRTQVLLALSSIYGEGNVKAAVTTTVDVNRRYLDSTTYEQPEGSYESGGLIGRDIEYFYITRDGLEPVGGVVGTTSNSDLPTYVGDLEQSIGDGDTAGSSRDRDNKINEYHEQTEVAACTITAISIAVTINENANNAAAVDVESLRSHVAAASGIGGENPEQYVSVLLAPFYAEPLPEAPGGLFSTENLPYLIIAAAVILLLLVLLIVILSVRRRKRRKQEEEQRALEEEQQQQAGEVAAITITSDMTPEEVEAAMAAAAEAAATAPTGGADIMEINTEKSMELRKTLRQFVQTNPEVAAQMLKTWLRGEEEGNG